LTVVFDKPWHPTLDSLEQQDSSVGLRSLVFKNQGNRI